MPTKWSRLCGLRCVCQAIQLPKKIQRPENAEGGDQLLCRKIVRGSKLQTDLASCESIIQERLWHPILVEKQTQQCNSKSERVMVAPHNNACSNMPTTAQQQWPCNCLYENNMQAYVAAEPMRHSLKQHQNGNNIGWHQKPQHIWNLKWTRWVSLDKCPKGRSSIARCCWKSWFIGATFASILGLLSFSLIHLVDHPVQSMRDTGNVIDHELWMKDLPSTWAFWCKPCSNGSVHKLKTRFCAQGDHQVERGLTTLTHFP
jgi:hypothetical protein